MNKADITIGKLREVCARLGYAFFELGDYNLNIIGIRSGDADSNGFNDVLCVAFKQSNRWICVRWVVVERWFYFRNDLYWTLVVTGGTVQSVDWNRR